MRMHVFGESPSIYFTGHINSVKILKQYLDSRFHNLSAHFILLCPRLLENNNRSASGVKCQNDYFVILLLNHRPSFNVQSHHGHFTHF